MSRTISLLAASAVLLFSCLPARAVTIPLSPVAGIPGIGRDVTGWGFVDHSYNIGTYDVTNSQYVEFLNNKDPTGVDALGLYYGDTLTMGIDVNPFNVDGNKYTAIPGAQNQPVTGITWYAAIRFANWLNNGQGNGDTETGAYTLMGGTPVPSNGVSITRNPGAKVFLPSANEWYKAAYCDPATSLYFLYPTGSNTAPTASGPTGIANHANFNNVVGHLTDVGAYTGTKSPYGAYDMAGNVFQWTDTWNTPVALQRIVGGGPLNFGSVFLRSSNMGQAFDGWTSIGFIGFRVASVVSIPEPSSAILAGLGFGGLIAWAWRRRKRLGPSQAEPARAENLGPESSRSV